MKNARREKGQHTMALALTQHTQSLNLDSILSAAGWLIYSNRSATSWRTHTRHRFLKRRFLLNVLWSGRRGGMDVAASSGANQVGEPGSGTRRTPAWSQRHKYLFLSLFVSFAAPPIHRHCQTRKTHSRGYSSFFILCFANLFSFTSLFASGWNKQQQ